jgi:flotillin
MYQFNLFQRSIMGNMSVEDIYRDRKLFSTRVFDVASSDLVNMGIMIISYTIKDITDDVGYLKVRKASTVARLTDRERKKMKSAKSERLLI